MRSVTGDRRRGNLGFQRIVDAFLTGDGLPFATVFSAERIAGVFASHDNLFGMNTIYSTAIVVWAFLAQSLRDGKEASCRAAVAGIVAWRLQHGLAPPTADTGETALFRELLDSLDHRDVVVADRFYCSFMMLALLLGRGVDGCVRMHQRRHVDFRRGRRLGKYDHLIEWHRPQRPEWMDETTYAAIPEVLVLREIRFQITEPGRRVRSLTVVTTLVDPDEYSTEDIAELYGFRWHSELDIRSIKQTLGLDHVRSKSPSMVRKELWTTLLAYNLIRTTAAAAALLHGKKPRQISFTGTCQHVLSTWMLLSTGACSDALLLRRTMLDRIASCEVADRPGRIEPRVLKRRRHRYPLMQRPRNQLRQELHHANISS